HIVHGDLRPSNILFNKKGNLKITDFGFERHYEQVSETDWYQPENRATASVSRDIYSAGIIFYQMLTGNMASLKFGLLKVNKDFEKLDESIQGILQNMLEMQSVTCLQSFADVMTGLQAIPLKAIQKKSSQLKKKPTFSIKLFLLFVLLVNIGGLLTLYFLNDDFQQFIRQLMAGFN
ncbi:MAG: protein kinase, partial [Thiotrichaceae bacterium]|nr:protein kinase [Thiotrichaceae bacterium]